MQTFHVRHQLRHKPKPKIVANTQFDITYHTTMKTEGLRQSKYESIRERIFCIPRRVSSRIKNIPKKDTISDTTTKNHSMETQYTCHIYMGLCSSQSFTIKVRSLSPVRLAKRSWYTWVDHNRCVFFLFFFLELTLLSFFFLHRFVE
jgi:hypothetical protein